MLLSKGRRRNKVNVQPELLRATGSAEPPVQRHTLQDLTNRQSKVRQMTRLEDCREEEEELTAGQDDLMPQLISQASSPHHEQEQNDAVTLKKIVLATQKSTSEESTAADEIGSDDGTELTEDESPQYNSPSDDNEVEYLEVPKQKRQIRFVWAKVWNSTNIL